MKALLGKKIGMTQVFTEEGEAVTVTVIQAGPCAVIQRKTADTDGYDAVQIGFEDAPEKKFTKPELGHFKKHGVTPKRYVSEFRVEDASGLGEELTVSVFDGVDYVDVTGTSKGKGFAGAMKRHGFGGGPASHGAHRVHRTPNSTGAVDAARTFKGVKKPGQMGNKTVTSIGHKVVRIDGEHNLLLVKGSVPGANGRLVTIRESVKKR